MSQIVTIARAAVTEHVRRKLVLFFGVLALLATGMLLYVNLNRDLAETFAGLTVGLAAILSLGMLSGMATLAAVAVSMNNIGRPFSDGEASMILARPVARWQYALGRMLGSTALVACLCLVIALLLQGINLMEQRGLGAELWGHWATQAFNLTLLVAITTLLSALFSNPILAGLGAFFIYTSSTVVATLYLLVDTGRVGGIPGAAITLAWYLTPKRLISPLNLRQIDESGDLMGAGTMMLIPSTWLRVLWAVVYLAVTIGATLVVVQRKDL